MSQPSSKLTAKRRAEVAVLLSKVCHRNESGHAEYINGYSDVKVAKELDCSTNSVAYIRLAMFGNFKPSGPPPGHNLHSVLKRLEQIEGMVKRMYKDLYGVELDV